MYDTQKTIATIYIYIYMYRVYEWEHEPRHITVVPVEVLFFSDGCLGAPAEVPVRRPGAATLKGLWDAGKNSRK